MKEFRILYWLGLYKTERIIKAASKEEAKKTFIERTGNEQIIKIEKMA